MKMRAGVWTMTLVLCLGLGLAGACGTTPRPESRSAARIKDSAPEKVAAQRSAGPGLGLEADEQRWGIEAARERRRRQLEAERAASAPGPVDLHACTPDRKEGGPICSSQPLE
jgi:hypothetical protein